MSFEKYVGVFYDTDTVRFHLSQLPSFNLIQACTSYNNLDSFLQSECYRKLAVLHVPYPFQDNFIQLVNKLQLHCNHIFIIATEVHPEIVEFIKGADYTNVSFYLCGALNFHLRNANVSSFLDWFETTTYFYKNWLPEILTRLKPYEEKSKFFDILLGRKKLHRDQIYLQCKMGPDIGEISYFNDTDTNLDDPQKWIWEKNGVNYKNKPQWTVDQVEYYGYPMSISQVIPFEVYNRTTYSVIAETCFHNDFAFFTEKTCKPIIAKRLFILFAGRHYLKNLKNLGFKTFDGIIDESYDNEEDMLLRWKMAYQQMIFLSQQSQSSILEKIQPIVEHNFNIMMSTKWADNFRFQLEKDIVRVISG